MFLGFLYFKEGASCLGRGNFLATPKGVAVEGLGIPRTMGVEEMLRICEWGRHDA